MVRLLICCTSQNRRKSSPTLCSSNQTSFTKTFQVWLHVARDTTGGSGLMRLFLSTQKYASYAYIMCLATVSEKSISFVANRKKISHPRMNHTCCDLHLIAHSPAWLKMWLLQSPFCAKGGGGPSVVTSIDSCTEVIPRSHLTFYTPRRRTSEYPLGKSFR